MIEPEIVFADLADHARQRPLRIGRGGGGQTVRQGLWASCKARYKPDQIAAVVQPLIIDWPITGGIRRALNEEDRTAGRHLQRLGGDGIGGGRLQLVFSFDERRTVFVLQQCEDRLGLEVVLRNLLPYSRGKYVSSKDIATPSARRTC
jgi:hypothetical protein